MNIFCEKMYLIKSQNCPRECRAYRDIHRLAHKKKNFVLGKAILWCEQKENREYTYNFPRSYMYIDLHFSESQCVCHFDLDGCESDSLVAII